MSGSAVSVAGRSAAGVVRLVADPVSGVVRAAAVPAQLVAGPPAGGAFDVVNDAARQGSSLAAGATAPVREALAAVLPGVPASAR